MQIPLVSGGIFCVHLRKNFFEPSYDSRKRTAVMRISITDGTGEVLWCIVAFIAAAETVSPFSMNGIAMRQAKKLITAAEIRVSIIGFSGICPEVTVLTCNITHSPPNEVRALIIGRSE